MWTGIVALNTFAMLLLYLFFPETLHKKDDKEESKKDLSLLGAHFPSFSIIVHHFRMLFGRFIPLLVLVCWFRGHVKSSKSHSESEME